MGFWVMFCIALAVSAIGFHKFVWFISLGYGFSMAAIGVALLVMFAPGASADAIVPLVMSALLVAYGLRLGGYLLVRERRSAAYNKVMKTQVNDGSGLGLPVKILVWGSCALLYACEAAPIYFRLANGTPADACAVVGALIMVGGIVLESAADLQKDGAEAPQPAPLL